MITVNLIIPDTSFQMTKTFPRNTQLKQVSNFLCEQLDLDFLDTEFSYNHQYRFQTFRLTNTLNQIGIKQNGNLICNLQNSKFEGANFFKSKEIKFQFDLRKNK
jgi:hypothetical protein